MRYGLQHQKEQGKIERRNVKNKKEMSLHFDEFYQKRYDEEMEPIITPDVIWDPMFTKIEGFDPSTLLTGFNDEKFLALCKGTETKYEKSAMDDIRKISMNKILKAQRNTIKTTFDTHLLL
jgi:hypothetical protein